MKKRWLIPSMLSVIVILLFFLVVFQYEVPLTTSAQILFSALLVVTSFFLVRGQRAFNKYVKDRDTPDLIVVGHPELKFQRRTAKSKEKLSVWLSFVVTNPAPTIAQLWKVRIESSELSNESWEMINWGSTPVNPTEGQRKPALVMPSEIRGVVFRASVDLKTSTEAKAMEKLKWGFDYRIGNYEKSTEYERDVTRKEQ